MSVSPRPGQSVSDSRRGVPFAVVADPKGDRFVEAPATRRAMQELTKRVAAAGERIFCANAWGGCGEPVGSVAGPQRRPHFRHPPRSNCSWMGLDYSTQRDLYTHHVAQIRLIEWVQAQGYEARKEQYLDRRSRVDILTSPPWVIEVQRSTETELSWQERTQRYGGKVTWLFSDHGPLTSRDTALEDDGHVLLFKLVNRGNFRDCVLIGIRTARVGTQPQHDSWFDLDDCRFAPERGVIPPGLDAHINRIADLRRAARDQAAVAATTKPSSTQRGTNASAATTPAKYSPDQRARLRQLGQQAVDAKPQTEAERIRAMYSRLTEAASIIRGES